MDHLTTSIDASSSGHPGTENAALSWSASYKPDHACSYDHCYANTSFGQYLVTWKSWKDHPNFSVEFRDEFVTAANSLEDAKHLAQEDFRQRLGEALGLIDDRSAANATEVAR